MLAAVELQKHLHGQFGADTVVLGAEIASVHAPIQTGFHYWTGTLRIAAASMPPTNFSWHWSANRSVMPAM